MAELDYDLYDLAEAVESISHVISGFDTADTTDTTRFNPYIKNLGINFDKESAKYYDCLYSLCEIIIKQGMVDVVREELKSDNADEYYFNEIIEDIQYRAKEAEHEDLIYSVEVGDKVRLYNGNVRYVADIDGNSIWVTNDESKRDSIDARGWSAQLSDIVEILEKYNEE